MALATAGTPGTEDWFLLRLGARLSDDLPRLSRLHQYDCGDHPLPIGNAKMRETYRRFQQMARSNYTGLIAESVRERCRPLGFVSGTTGSQEMDQAAWRIWQANFLDSGCASVHHKALALSRSYVMVGPNPDDRSLPYITPESPFQVIHEYDPLRPRWVAAALKVYFDPIQEVVRAFVYTPKYIVTYRYSTEGQVTYIDWSSSKWTQEKRTRNPVKQVPIVPFINRRERGGMGEFEDVTDIQDRINTTSLQRLVIQEMQAFRQRWAKGIQLEDEQGNPIRPFDPGADLLWHVEDEDAEFGDFAQADIAPIAAAIHGDVQDMAAISRTPPHYLLASVANVSGDALAAAEVGLTSKVRDRLAEFGESWEQVIRIAGMFAGISLPDDLSMQWADPERHTLAEIADAMPKVEDTIPWSLRMQMAGFDPQTIARAKAEKDTEQAEQDARDQQAFERQSQLAQQHTQNQPPSGGPSGAKPPANSSKPAPQRS